MSLPVIILGPDLRIRRFTPMAERALSLFPGDVGRQLSDLRLSLEVPDLQERILDVLHNLHSQEIELRDRSGRWHSVRIRPYRTAENQIDGAVVVFVDIDRLRRSLDQAQSLRSLAQAVLDSLPDASAVVDSEYTLRLANRAFRQTFELPEEVDETSIFELLPKALSEVELRRGLQKALENEAEVSVGLRKMPRRRLSIKAWSVDGSTPLLLLGLKASSRPAK